MERTVGYFLVDAVLVLDFSSSSSEALTAALTISASLILSVDVLTPLFHSHAQI